MNYDKVHQSHCSVEDGCKYGNPQCPVSNKLKLSTPISDFKLIDDQTAAEIHKRVNDWQNPIFSTATRTVIKEFLANEKGFTFYERIAVDIFKG